MIAFRQQIRRGDVGYDVTAVKRALRAMGARGWRRFKMNRAAGDGFNYAIRALQHDHGLSVDGVYGQKTHAIVAPHFDGFGRYLYRSAPIRRRSLYVNPFRAASITTGRVDMGVDFHGHGPILALGDGIVNGLGGRGWPGGEYLLYTLSRGIHAGRHVYVAEGIVPAVRASQRIRAGQVVAYFRHDAFPGFFPGIETGWGTSTLNLTYAAVTSGYREGQRTPAGLAFARLLHELGVGGLDVGHGPTFP